MAVPSRGGLVSRGVARDPTTASASPSSSLGGGDQHAPVVTAAPARTADRPAWLDDPLVAPAATLAPAAR